MDKHTLLTEGLLAKFLRYVRFGTQSAEEADRVPSTPGQLTFANHLSEELKALGLDDASVDARGFVTAALPSQIHGCPTLGFIAHLDTFPGVPGENVSPVVHDNYDGGDIQLPGGPTLMRSQCADLRQVIGHTLITSDGRTLLGADDKAGIAEVMEALCRLIGRPDLVHGSVKVAFTPDEEVGGAIKHFNLAAFGADVAYTLDGGGIGLLEDENFNATNLRIVITGKSAHTGAARGAMINAIHLASELVGAIPAVMRPETTDGAMGFIHPDHVEGDVEKVRIKLLLRDFKDDGLSAKEAMIRGLCRNLMRRHPGSKVTWSKIGGYRNMEPALQKSPEVIALAKEAIRLAGIEPEMHRVRGGTDGARLTHMGLPTPNLFTGGANFHSRTEWVSLQWMEKAVEVIVNLCDLWSRQPPLR
jgi:tripeptide aminopeptidase